MVSLYTKQNSIKCPFGPDEHLRPSAAVLQGLENVWDSLLSNIAGKVANWPTLTEDTQSDTPHPLCVPLKPKGLCGRAAQSNGKTVALSRTERVSTYRSSRWELWWLNFLSLSFDFRKPHRVSSPRLFFLWKLKVMIYAGTDCIVAQMLCLLY